VISQHGNEVERYDVDIFWWAYIVLSAMRFVRQRCREKSHSSSSVCCLK
jgi:hypothetical protein